MKDIYFSLKKIYYFLTILFISFSNLLFAQAVGSIGGKISDKSTGEELFGANVVIKGTTYGSSTDFEGNYKIRNMPVGSYILEVSYIGYNPKTVNIDIVENRLVNIDVELEFKVIEGEVVVVTGQAEGQIQAINKQLTSNTIANVVSENRIKELPDVNAAESIGRLPGVSINRSGGEANKISIRGLDPKYNTITVNGVRVPSTGGDDRSVDLSLISSNMLAGIELKKANTPDMDADALGGTVDLRLKEAEPGLKLNTSVQMGHNQLQDYYGNYNFTGNVSNRFLDNNLGLILNFNLDHYDRSADKFDGTYDRENRDTNDDDIDEIVLVPEEISLREVTRKQDRLGGSILLDYKIPNGKVTANAFFNRMSWEELNNVNRLNINQNRHYYDIEDQEGSTSVFTGALGFNYDLGFMSYDVGVSRTSTETDIPENNVFAFGQEQGALQTSSIDYKTHPRDIQELAFIDTNGTALSHMFKFQTNRIENETAIQFNLKFPFQFGNDISGYLKTGGKFRWMDRENDEEQDGKNGLQYSSGSLSDELSAILRNAAAANPGNWNYSLDSALIREHEYLPISRVLSDYKRKKFLDGEYELGMVADIDLLNELLDALEASDGQEGNLDQYLNYAVGSLGRDYDGIEEYSAGYIMAEVDVTKYFTIIPGIRYEKDYSKYTGQRFREVDNAFTQLPPVDFERITVKRENEFWLPMVHLIVNPTDWLKIRLARTETLTRPDYIHYAPITQINSYQSYVRANNTTLKPSHSVNYDIAVSIYENYTGFFTISGFYKEIEDLIFQEGYLLNYDKGIPIIDGLNIPVSWVTGASPHVDTYINNSNKAFYRGFELEWQTNFWYLPSVLKGLVLNVNYTRIFSDVEKDYIDVDVSFVNRPPPFPPAINYAFVDSTRSARMPFQPSHILNITLGYDYKGFSTRLSYLYQSDKVTYLDQYKELDSFSDDYSRWDLSLQQRLDWGIQVFANFSNLNSRPDVTLRGGNNDRPAYLEYYGFTMDLGVRFKL